MSEQKQIEALSIEIPMQEDKTPSFSRNFFLNILFKMKY